MLAQFLSPTNNLRRQLNVLYHVETISRCKDNRKRQKRMRYRQTDWPIDGPILEYWIAFTRLKKLLRLLNFHCHLPRIRALILRGNMIAFLLYPISIALNPSALLQCRRTIVLRWGAGSCDMPNTKWGQRQTASLTIDAPPDNELHWYRFSEDDPPDREEKTWMAEIERETVNSGA